MEKKNNMKATLLSIGALAALLMAGCSQEAKSDMSAAGDSASNAMKHTGDAVTTDANKAGAAVKETGDKAVEGVKDAGQAVASGAEKAGATVVAGAQEAGNAVKNGAEAAADSTMTPKVKTALHGVAGLDVSKVDVDTAGKTVTLKGSVPDAASKKKAEEAAKLAAGSEFKVVNNLTVGG